MSSGPYNTEAALQLIKLGFNVDITAAVYDEDA